MLRVSVVTTFLIFTLSASAQDPDVYASLALRIMRFVAHCCIHISLPPSLQCFSEAAWKGLEKPLGTFRTETFAECGQKTEQEDCDLMHFNRHDNRGYKWCTPAKVDSREIHRSQTLYSQITCIHPDYQLRKKKCGYGPVPCPEDVFIYIFTELEIPHCESVLIININLSLTTFLSVELSKSYDFPVFKIRNFIDICLVPSLTRSYYNHNYFYHNYFYHYYNNYYYNSN